MYENFQCKRLWLCSLYINKKNYYTKRMYVNTTIHCANDSKKLDYWSGKKVKINQKQLFNWIIVIRDFRYNIYPVVISLVPYLLCGKCSDYCKVFTEKIIFLTQCYFNHIFLNDRKILIFRCILTIVYVAKVIGTSLKCDDKLGSNSYRRVNLFFCFFEFLIVSLFFLDWLICIISI